MDIRKFLECEKEFISAGRLVELGLARSLASLAYLRSKNRGMTWIKLEGQNVYPKSEVIEYLEKRRRPFKRVSELPTSRDEVMLLGTGNLDLTFRVASLLGNAGLNTVAQIIEKTEDELLAIPQFGLWCLDHLKRGLARYGLTLKTPN
jgi:DNA-directed RNA polymerase alpha subunit